jgi:hypothetical protein
VKRTLLSAFVLVLFATTFLPAQSLEQRMAEKLLSLPQKPLEQYTAVREMIGSGLGKKATMIVETSQIGKTFIYKVLSEDGSEKVRNDVFREILIREKAAIKKGDDEKFAFSANNYSISKAIIEGGNWKLWMKPKDKDVSLYTQCVMTLTTEGEIKDVSGGMKSPSWKVRNVTLNTTFEQVNGVRMPVKVTSYGEAIILGPFAPVKLEIKYDYKFVNYEPVVHK